MKARTTPLGFLSGDIEVHSHCMYTYTKKDETFLHNVVDFLTAGLAAREVGICVFDGPIRDEVKRRIVERRANSDLQYEDEQLIMCTPSDVYLRDGMLDPPTLVNHWQSVVEPVARRMNGVRVFSDTEPMFFSRTVRLKLLENEALINLSNPMTVWICGYRADLAGRSYLAQARNVHPYIANSRSIRRNPTYLSTTRFLSGFYRFRRVSKEYPATTGMANEVGRDLVYVAGRTPLTMREIEDLRVAVVGSFVHMVEQGASVCDRSHLHITFTTESDKVLITLRDHTLGLLFARSEDNEHVYNSRYCDQGLVDEISMESWKMDLVATIVKRYQPPCFISASERSSDILL